MSSSEAKGIEGFSVYCLGHMRAALSKRSRPTSAYIHIHTYSACMRAHVPQVILFIAAQAVAPHLRH